MKEEYAVEIDMSQIEAKENFNLVTKLTTLISLILLIFACVEHHVVCTELAEFTPLQNQV